MGSPDVMSLPRDDEKCGRITVRNWSRFQHYKQRRPPWIKLHRELLDDYEYSRLPLASRALAPCLWLIASEADDGSFPDDIPLLVFRLRCTEAELLDALKPLIERGFLSCLPDASVLLAARKQETRPEERRVEERNDNGKQPSNQSSRLPLEGGVGGGRANPLMGERPKRESELLRLVAREGVLTDRDPVEVMCEVTGYEGARTSKLNPASMTDDRLLNSLLDARSRVARLEKEAERVGQGLGRQS